MSNDIAVLGIKVDSSSAVTAASNLNQLAAAAKPAAAGTSALQQAANQANVSLGAHGKAAAAAGNAHAGLSTQAMAAQHSIRSMIEMLAMGVPPTQVLTSQMNHLSYAASGPGGLKAAFGDALGALRNLISPLALAAGGITAVGVAGVMAAASIAKTEIAFDDTARSIGSTIGQLHSLESAAAFKGIAADDFLKGMQNFGRLVYEARNNMGSLAEVFRANNVSAQSFTDHLERAADLIKNAKDDQTRLALLQQMGLPATMDWVRFLSQGVAAIRAAAADATKFNDAADQAMVAKAREFDEAWNRTWKNFSNGAKNAIILASQGLSGLGDLVTRGLMHLPGSLGASVPNAILATAMQNGSGSRLTANSDVSQFYSGLAIAGRSAAPAVDPNKMAREIALATPRLGHFGQTPIAKQADKKESDDDCGQHRRAA